MGLIKTPAKKSGSTAKKTVSKPKSTAKPTSTAKKTTTKASAKKVASAKKTTSTAKSTPAKASSSNDGARRGLANIDQRTLKSWISRMEKSAKRLKNAQIEHDEASEEVHSVAAEAREADIPMSIVTETLGVSRQYLYKGLKGNGPNGRKGGGTTAKKTTKRAASKSSTKTTGNSRTVKRASGTGTKSTGKKLLGKKR